MLKLKIFLVVLVLFTIWLTACQPASKSPVSGLEVYFLDVGQGDAEILKSGNSAMLIDAGPNISTSTLIKDIKNLGISKFDVVIGTHPHEDHIGGLDQVIKQFAVDTIYMPKVSENTKTFEDVLTAISNKGLKITSPTAGTSFSFGSTTCSIVAPNSSAYSETNNYSIVLKVVNGNNAFLFTGDAEVESEKEILAKGFNLKSNVLKVGHHGSVTSTSSAFLKSVNPEHAVIEVGNNNDYGHPHQETLNKLRSAGIKTYRTDVNGTIKMSSDGTAISIKPQKGG